MNLTDSIDKLWIWPYSIRETSGLGYKDLRPGMIVEIWHKVPGELYSIGVLRIANPTWGWDELAYCEPRISMGTHARFELAKDLALYTDLTLTELGKKYLREVQGAY
jgi:hypothetical protein